MNTWDGVEDLKFYLGTEDPINTVMEFDNADRAKDYEKMRSMTTDTTTFIGGNGIVKSVDEFFDQKELLKIFFTKIGLCGHHAVE